MKRRKFFKTASYSVAGGVAGLTLTSSREAFRNREKDFYGDELNELREDKPEYIPLNLMSPPAAQTESSIALIWDKPAEYKEIKHYVVYRDGKLAGEVERTDFTDDNLSSGVAYSYSVRSALKEGSLSEKSNKVIVSTHTKGQVFDITRYGAVGDGKTLNTKAIQQAIGECTPGGLVYLPAGVFLSGALWLKSDMTLHISKGATLLGSPKATDYPLTMCRFEGRERRCYSSLVNGGELRGPGVDNVIITGGGRIDGNGTQLRISEEDEDRKGPRGRVVCFRNSKNIFLNNITIAHSPCWCTHFIYCENVSVNNIKIYTRADESGNVYEGIHNGDGLNPDSSRNFYIFNSMIASQDDCIAIKSGKDEEGRRIGKPSENIRITNCSFKSGGGVVVGSEMSGGVRNLLVRDCEFDDVRALNIKSRRGRGGTVENIRYEDIRFINMENRSPGKWSKGAINIDLFYGYEEPGLNLKPVDEGTPVLKNISFKNITVNTSGRYAIYLMGLPESPVKNIRLENIQAIGKFGFKAMNVEGLEMKNLSVNAGEGDDYIFNNVDF